LSMSSMIGARSASSRKIAKHARWKSPSQIILTPQHLFSHR
jgi:hypothetical protein